MTEPISEIGFADMIQLDLTQMATAVMVPVALLNPEARVDFDHMMNSALISFRGSLVSSESSTQRATFGYTEHLKPWWIPGFVWKRVPSRNCSQILEVKFSATHPYADIPQLQDRLGPTAVKARRSLWVEHPK